MLRIGGGGGGGEEFILWPMFFFVKYQTRGLLRLVLNKYNL